MSKFKRRALIGIFGLIGLGVLYLGTGRILKTLQQIELQLVDFRYVLTAEPEKAKDLVIVEVDNASIDRLSAWPWPRSFYGQVADQLNKAGAKVIGFDILFDSDSALGHQEDQSFGDVLKKIDRVVLASKRYTEKRDRFHIESWSIPIGVLREGSDYGFVNQITDMDNSIRRSILHFETQSGRKLFSWDLHLFAHYLDLDPKDLTATQQGIQIGDRFIPGTSVGGQGYFMRYYGGPRTFKHIPFYQVLDGRLDNLSELVKDKIVLIGATDPILHDFFYTPFGVNSGVEVHANAIQTMLDQSFIWQLSPLWNGLILACIVGTVMLISYKTRIVIGAVSVLLLLSLYSVSVVLVFMVGSVLIWWVYPVTLSGLIYLGVVIARFIKEEKEKKQIKGMFQQYVSPTVVEELINNPSKLKLGGEKSICTVFFSDIRSFTTFSESHTPEQVVEILNEYLDAMTKVIFKWKGTLDKYVGDEIMAVWGAPVAQPDHAELAVRSCWEQLAVLRELQEKWRSEGKSVVDIGMGLNTGEMITGNIGSSVHKDYTVIGDAVNLGARLEAETRNYGTPEEPCYLIISEMTYELVKDIVEVKPLGDVTVKGKTKPVSIYEVINVK